MTSLTARAGTTAVAVALLLTCLGGCVARGDTERRDDRRFPFSGQSLTIDAHETRLTVVNGSTGEVAVERELRGTAAEDGNASWSLRGGTLSLRVDCVGVVLSCESEHRVRVPEGIALTIEGSGGAVRLENLTGDITTKLGNDGSLRIDGPAGRLRLWNGGGHIHVTRARSSDVEATTSADGNIDLAFTTAPRRVEARASESVEITLPAGPETYRVDATGRGVDVPSDPGSDRLIVARAGDGSVSIRKAR